MGLIDYTKATIGITVQFAKAGFKVRNEGTWLGVAWYLISPLCMFILLATIFSSRLGKDIPHYPLYLLVGLIMFNFFQTITIDAARSIRMSGGLVKSLFFPPESIVGGVVLKILYVHLFELSILIAFFIYFKASVSALLFYPIVLIPLIIFTTGIALFLASVGTYVFDIDNVWNFLVKLLWFATPIFYSITELKSVQLLNMANPMYFIITFARSILIDGQLPEMIIIFGTCAYSIISFGIGMTVFVLLKKRFAELL